MQDGCEANAPVYTAQEAEEKIKVHREKTIQADKRLQPLRSMAERQRISKETVSVARQSLEALRDVNPDTATYVDKRNLIVKLGMKIYPSEDARSIRIACHASPSASQIISMASPKL